MHTLQPKYKITKFNKNKNNIVQQKYNILGTRQVLSINIEKIWVNSRLILTMTMIIIHRFFVDVQIHNIFHKLIQFHLCKFYAQKKKKKVLVVLESIKFQFPIISLVNFCNYSLFFSKFKIYVGYKKYLTNLK